MSTTAQPKNKVLGTFHITWNINLLKRLILTDKDGGGGLLVNKKTGKDLTKKEALRELDKLKRKGYSCLPVCDNIKKDGTCKGHKK